MTSEEIELLIAEGDPLTPTDWTLEKHTQMLEEQKQVQQRCAEEYSSSPLWRARVEKDPQFWNKFSTGRIR